MWCNEWCVVVLWLVACGSGMVRQLCVVVVVCGAVIVSWRVVVIS